jgi:hypothetical protein
MAAAVGAARVTRRAADAGIVRRAAGRARVSGATGAAARPRAGRTGGENGGQQTHETRQSKRLHGDPRIRRTHASVAIRDADASPVSRRPAEAMTRACSVEPIRDRASRRAARTARASRGRSSSSAMPRPASGGTGEQTPSARERALSHRPSPAVERRTRRPTASTGRRPPLARTRTAPCVYSTAARAPRPPRSRRPR